jgi:hypothetical protein
MIPDDIKKPPTFSANPAEVKQLDDFLKSKTSSTSDGNIQVTFSKRQWQLLCAISNSFLWLVSLLSIKKIGIDLIRRVFNISPPSSPPNNINNGRDSDGSGDTTGDNDDEDSENEGNIEGEDGGSSEGDPVVDPSASPTPKPKTPRNKNHQGKRTSKDFSEPTLIVHNHPNLKSGDSCPQDQCTGRLYTFLINGKMREVITFNFTPPFEPTVHQLNNLRCNLCSTVFKVPLPENLIKDGAAEGSYLYPAQAALVLLHYGLGMPSYRLDHFQSMVGERFPESTQFDIFENVANDFSGLVNALECVAADGFLLQGDDVSNRVLNLDAELRERRSDKKIVVREGVHTSLLIATTDDGHLVPVLKTGINHFGELLDEVLSKRSPDLAIPMLVCDANKVNKSYAGFCVTGGCWQHSRDYFKKAQWHFPRETDVFKNLIKQIFEVDRKTHEMDASTRLAYLKEHAFPFVEEIEGIVNGYVDNKVVLPKSTLGEAFFYFQAQYKKLCLPFEKEGVPLHNNISEWCTYLVVRLLANSKFYKNDVGAVIGDTLITVILTCYLSLINPYDYILYCLRNKEAMKEKPEDFFPWKLRDLVKAMPKHKQMKFWAPSPPRKKAVEEPLL